MRIRATGLGHNGRGGIDVHRGKAFFCLAAALFVLTAFKPPLSRDEAALLAAYEQGDVIRLHILADSDAPEDQRVKLAVRDAIIDDFGSRFCGDDPDAIFEELKQQAEAVCQTARACALENGFEGEVSVQVGVLDLPSKTYGSVTLPAGAYRALRVTLGSGQGQNWWCVLFPRLCLSFAEDDEPAHGWVWDSARILRCWLALEV